MSIVGRFNVIGIVLLFYVGFGFGQSMYSYNDIQYLPYLGGSLSYTNEFANSHLQQGGQYAFRLGKLSKVLRDVSNDSNFTAEEKSYLASHGGFPEYSDIENRALFGVLYIESINLSSIEFRYVLYDTEGDVVRNDNAVVNLGTSLDFDKDGKVDVKYTSEISSFRSNNEGIKYGSIAESVGDFEEKS